MSLRTSGEAREYYNDFLDYDEYTKTVKWKIPTMVVSRLTPYLKGGERVADIGCGTGLVGDALFYSNWSGRLFGVDLAEDLMKKACEKPIYTNCVQGNAYHLPFSDNSFDVVVSTAMIGLTGVNSIKEMKRIVKPSGYLACAAGQLNDRPWSRKRLKAAINFFSKMPGLIQKEDLGSGYASSHRNERYVYYLFRAA